MGSTRVVVCGISTALAGVPKGLFRGHGEQNFRASMGAKNIGKIPKIVNRVWACYITFSSENMGKIFGLACRPRRDRSHALKNVPRSQWEPKSLKGGPRVAAILARSLVDTAKRSV
jgi:hypothetical protein